jgi:hypothetical protein
MAERGLRGRRLPSLKLASVGAASLALTCHPGGGGYGSPTSTGTLLGSRE